VFKLSHDCDDEDVLVDARDTYAGSHFNIHEAIVTPLIAPRVLDGPEGRCGNFAFSGLGSCALFFAFGAALHFSPFACPNSVSSSSFPALVVFNLFFPRISTSPFCCSAGSFTFSTF